MMGARNEPTERDLRWILKEARIAALAMGASAYEADEVSQLTVMKLWIRWNRPELAKAMARGTASWRSYVRQTARNMHRDLIRQHQRRIARQTRAAENRERESYLGSPGWAPSTPYGVEAYLARATIAEEIMLLPERQREVASRYILEDMSINDIAAKLGVQPQSVRKHLRAARDALKRRIAEAEKQLQ